MSTRIRPGPVQHHGPVHTSAGRRSGPDILSQVMAVIPNLLRGLALGTGSAVLLYLCFFPANLGILAWVALVPLLLLVRTNMHSAVAGVAAWSSGLALYVAQLQWVRVAHPMMYYSWLALAFYCSLYLPLAVWLLRRIDRLPGVPMALAVPVVWTSLEYLRGNFLTGFPWYFLGHSQHDHLAVVQIADLGGAYAVTIVVAAVNGLVCDLLCRSPRLRALLRIPDHSKLQRLQLVPAVAVAVLLAATLGYGVWRIGQTDFAEGPRVVLLQSNIDQGTRSAKSNPSTQVAGDNPSARMLKHLEELTIAGRQQPADLMIWPETTCPTDWVEVRIGLDPERLSPETRDAVAWHRQRIGDIARYSRTSVLLGLNSLEIRDPDPDARMDRFNSALLVDAGGTARGRYDKIHCVPFGEYVPMRETFPWMRVFTPYETDYSLTPGRQWTRFTLPTDRGEFRFGVVICYEDSVPELARSYAVDEGPGRPPVDFLVNISNDGWFDGTEEHEQHFAICRFRAIESRRAVARAVNMGISGVIDGNGRVVSLSGPTWQTAKKVATTVTATVPIDHRTSVYAHVGDWLPAGCAVCGLLGVVWSLRRRNGGRAGDSA